MTQRHQQSVRFGITYHAQITAEANDGVLDDQQLGLVIAANMAQDLRQTESKIHFDNCDFPGGVAYIEEEWALIDKAGQRFGEAALTAFGRLLHTTQDFYAHSNWIELHVDEAPVPVWDQRLSSLPADIVSGTFWLGFPKLCGHDAPTHEQLNKDSPTSPEGSKVVESGPNQGKTLFDLAFSTAVAASRIQFERFAALDITPRLEHLAEESDLHRLIRAASSLRG